MTPSGKNPLCIYHGNCADGFAAAWAVRHFFGAGNVDFHAGVYQTPPPNVAGREVILVDFSYKRPVLEQMLTPGDANQAFSILILDHHKSAAEDLAGIDKPRAGYDPGDWRYDLEQWGHGWPVRAVFDMERSGAGIAWDFFHPGQRRPFLLDHVEDRDLWRFAKPHTREVQAALFSYPYDFAVWDELMRDDRLPALRAEGEAIERKHFKDIHELVPVLKRRMTIGGVDVPVASLPYTYTSDAGHLMAKGEAFAACYWDKLDRREFSLRSIEGGADVSAIAVQYGGGGHKNAAGFSVPRDHELARA